MPQFLANVNLSKNELQNARVQNLGSAPSSPVEGQIYFDTGLDRLRVWDGAAWQSLETNTVTAVNGTAPIQVTGTTTRTISIDEATSGAAGSMSAADKGKLDAATAANTVSTIVMRDASGNFSAGTITASLTGTASNATQLNSQAASYYLARGNHTGTQLAATISDFDTQVRTSRLDQMAAPTAAVSLNNQKITNLADPTADTDAANKRYVDIARQGLDFKDSVRVATTANITLSGTQTIDGVAVVAGDRVLVKDQTTASQNGIYTVAAGAWTRTVDADSSGELSVGTLVYVEAGTANGGTQQVVTATGATPWVPGTSTSTWSQFSGANSISAGAGLIASGQVFNVVGTANRITVNADSVDIASTYVGQTSITTLGTITAGTWNGTTIAVANGGSGRVSNTAYMPIVGGTTTTGAHQSVATGAATGQALTYQGASAVPAFAAINLAGGTNIVTGALPATNGGTGLSTTTANAVLIGAAGNTITQTAAGSANQVLRIPGAGGAPAFGAIDIAQAAAVTGVLAIANGGTNATAANYTSGKFLAYDGTRLSSTAYDQTSFATAGHTHASSTSKYATAIGDGTSTNIVVTHNLGSQDVIVEVAEAATPWAKVYPDIEHTSTTTITVRFATAPTSGQYRVTVVG